MYKLIAIDLDGTLLNSYGEVSINTRKALLEAQLPSFEGLAFWLVLAIILNIVGIHIIHKNENSYAKVI